MHQTRERRVNVSKRKKKKKESMREGKPHP